MSGGSDVAEQPGDVVGSSNDTNSSTETITNSIGMKFAYCPAGVFLMGSPESERDRSSYEEQHRVRITKPFYLGIYEVTQADFERVMDYNPTEYSVNQSIADGDTGQFPVSSVTWHEAVEFCQKLSDMPQEKLHGRTYRLPTEAEWEYSCRAGSNAPFSFGGELAQSQATVGPNGSRKQPRAKPTPDRDTPEPEDPSPLKQRQGETTIDRDGPSKVGSREANAWGLCDMHGNVGEWCQDNYEEDYYEESPSDDPTGPQGSYYSGRVVRGGCWSWNAELARSAARSYQVENERTAYIGFRVAMEQPTP